MFNPGPFSIMLVYCRVNGSFGASQVYIAGILPKESYVAVEITR